MMHHCGLPLQSNNDFRVEEASMVNEAAIYHNPQHHELFTASRFNQDFEDIYSIISKEFTLNDSSTSEIQKSSSISEVDDQQNSPEIENKNAEENFHFNNKDHEKIKSNDSDIAGILQLSAEATHKSNQPEPRNEAYVKNSSSQTPNHFQCSRCESVYFQKYLLEAHVKIFHKTVWPRKITVQNSTAEVKCKNDLYCELCDKYFTNIKKATLHDTIFHRIVTPQKCSFCSKDFNTQILLDKHIIKAHPSRRPLSCGICGQSFALRKNMDTHISQHNHNHNLDKNNNSRSGDKNDVQSKKVEIDLKARLSTEFSESSQETKPSIKTTLSENETTGETILKESKEWQIDDDSKKISRKRRKLETGSVYSYSMKNENPVKLFKFECMKCHIILQSMSLVATHLSQCPNNFIAIDNSSHQEKHSRSESQKEDQQDDSDYPHKSECNSDDKMHNGFEEVLKKEMVIKCGFCSFTAKDFLVYNNHLLKHGI